MTALGLLFWSAIVGIVIIGVAAAATLATIVIGLVQAPGDWDEWGR